MLDGTTGDLEIQSLSIRIGSQFTRQQFLASALAEHARVLVQNEPYCTFSVGSYELAGLSLSVSLVFYGEQLETIGLFHDAKALASLWADWSAEALPAEAERHEQQASAQRASHGYRGVGMEPDCSSIHFVRGKDSPIAQAEPQSAPKTRVR